MLMAFASIGLTLWVTWQLEGGAAAVNEAGRMRMQTWRMAQTLARADAQQIAGLAAQFDQGVNVAGLSLGCEPVAIMQRRRLVIDRFQFGVLGGDLIAQGVLGLDAFHAQDRDGGAALGVLAWILLPVHG